MPDEIVCGSVIQRTFVGSDLPAALFAASVPLTDLGAKSMADIEGTDFKQLVAEILAVPSNALLDESEYQNLVSRLIGQNRWMRFRPDLFWEEFLFSWERREKELLLEMQSQKRPILMFAEHSIALMLSSPHSLSTMFWLPSDELRRGLDLETDETAFTTGVACMGARLQRSERTSDFTKTVLTYDLPLGNSPRASADSLLKLLDSGKTMCLAPMAAGGTLGVTQLSQGQYVAAILSVGTGSMMTLILLGSVGVGSLLVARVAQRRGDQRSKK